MTRADHQDAAIKRLEALFRDVKIQPPKSQPRVYTRTKIDKCCEIHGKSAPKQLKIPRTTPQRDAHPSRFASSLRRDTPVTSSTSSIKKSLEISLPVASSTPLRRGSVSSVKSVGNSNKTPLRRDNVTRSMSSLPKSGARSPLFTPARTSDFFTKTGELVDRSSSVSPSGSSSLKSCLSASPGSAKKGLSVHMRKDPVIGPVVGVKSQIGNARPLASSKKQLSDSLENLSKKSQLCADLPQVRCGSAGGSSGGWDDPIWEDERESCVDADDFVR